VANELVLLGGKGDSEDAPQRSTQRRMDHAPDDESDIPF
jgi:hypothetical protein